MLFDKPTNSDGELLFALLTVKNADSIGGSVGLAGIDAVQLLPFRKIIRRLPEKI
ncbi:hypothetical protein [Janthinobacterium sp. J1-1]|uniref:hypothetical protein n=1 Tax=unclassified Janthinobacterium TaxID=2610881 RepID=UPI0028122C7E|nr:hypothetical protein [Janthinobacterium sp. J1-1]